MTHRSTTLVLAVVIAALAFGFGAAGTAQAAPPDCTVNSGGGADYTTIQAAINNVACTTVTVTGGGPYAENVLITRPVTLTGQGSGSTTIAPAAGAAIELRTGATSVSISGFTLNGPTYGIMADWNNTLSITSLAINDVVATGSSQAGIVFGAGVTVSNLSISNSQFNNNASGLSIRGSGTTVSGSISSTTFNGSTTGHGIFITSSATVAGLSITGGSANDNRYTGLFITAGAQVSGLSIDGMTFTNPGSGRNGIAITGSTTVVNNTAGANTIANCTISGNGDHGFNIHNASVSYLTLSDCAINNNFNQGFFVQNSATLNTVTISGGTIQGNKWGVLTRASSVTNFLVDGVTVSGNTAGSGVSAASGTVNGFTVRNSIFQNNAWEDVDIGVGWIGALTASNVNVTSNTFLPGSGAAIYVADNVTGVGNIGIHFNRFARSGLGVWNAHATTVDAENNWWGCNGGPGTAGCASQSGPVDSDPWLVLMLDADEVACDPDGETTLYASLTTNSDDVDTSGGGVYVPDGIPVAFTTDTGSVTTPEATSSGVAASTLSGLTGADSAEVSAQVDNQTVYLTIDYDCSVPAPAEADTGLPELDITLDGSVSTSTAVVGDTIIWTFVIANGSGSDTYGLSFNAVLPGALTYVDAAASQGTIEFKAADNALWWDVGNIPGNTSASIVITTTLNAGAAAGAVPTVRARVVAAGGGKGIDKAPEQEAGSQVCLTGAVAGKAKTLCVMLGVPAAFPDELPATGGGQPPAEITVWHVLALAAMAALIGTTIYTLLRRRTPVR